MNPGLMGKGIGPNNGLVQPLLGLILLTVGTVAIAAAEKDPFLVMAVLTAKDRDPGFRGAAVDDCINDFAMFRRNIVAELLDILGSILTKNISDLMHFSPPVWGRS